MTIFLSFLFQGVEIKSEVKKIMFTMNKILDRELELEADGDLDYNEDAEIPQEILLPKSLVSTFCYEVAKMKANGLLNEVPKIFSSLPTIICQKYLVYNNYVFGEL